MLSRDLVPIALECLQGPASASRYRLRWIIASAPDAAATPDAIRRPRDTPIWKLEPALKYRSCRKPRYSPPVHMIKLTKEREITPYAGAHPDDDERR